MTLIHEDGVSFWDIPRLTTDGHDEEPDIEDPLSFIAYPSGSGPPEYEDGTVFSHYSGLCDWYTGSHQPLWFDYQNDDGLDTIFPFRLGITFSALLHKNTLLMDHLSTIPLPEVCSSTALPSRVVGGQQLRIFDTGVGISCHYSMQGLDGAAQDLFLEIPLIEGSSRIPEDSNSFCPFSGRFCYYPHNVSQPLMDIHVVDLFTSPT